MLLIKKIGFCALISLFLLLACWIWLQVDYTLANEGLQVKSSFLVKKLLSGNNSSFMDEFVFIDVSSNKVPVPRADSSGSDLITDRVQLDTFFKRIHRYPDYRYILCDVLFDKAAKGDSSLEQSLLATPRVIIPEIEIDNGIQPAIFPGTEQGVTSFAISSGFNSSGDAVKYQLLQNAGAKSIPLMMNERIAGQRAARFAGLLWWRGKIWFNRFIPSFRIWPEQMQTDSSSKAISLNYILTSMQYSDTSFAAVFRNKYIVIGDFNASTYSTVLGPMPGPLILANIFLSVQHGDNIISVWWLLYVWGAFTLLAYLLIYRPAVIKKWQNRLSKSPGGVLLAIEDLVFTFFVLWLLSILSYLLFKQHLNIVVPSICLSGYDVARKLTEKYKSKQKDTSKENHKPAS